LSGEPLKRHIITLKYKPSGGEASHMIIKARKQA